MSRAFKTRYPGWALVALCSSPDSQSWTIHLREPAEPAALEGLVTSAKIVFASSKLIFQEGGGAELRDAIIDRILRVS